MTMYILEGKQMVVDEKRLIDLANRWLPKGMSAEYKRKFADYVRFLISDLELDEPFYDCDGNGISVEQYYFLACLIYAWNNTNYFSFHQIFSQKSFILAKYLTVINI